MTTPTITISMDKQCAECGADGTADNGLCLRCSADAASGKKMTSENGKAVARRVASLKGSLEHDTKNSQQEGDKPVAKSGFAKEQLRSFVDRIERLEEEKGALAADIREVYSEAKGTGFDTKIIRKVIALRKLDKADFQEQEAILDLYLNALGMR